MKHLIALLFITLYIPAFADQLLLPNQKLTPGAVNPIATTEVICVRGYTAGDDPNGEPVRNVSAATKRKVFELYKIDPTSDKFEVDHLISLQLGGSNDITNLWPQSYTTKPLNARVKDGLENTLHSLICKGKVSLKTAQYDISTNWIEAYKKYVGPLPK
jgi:hypothetical protein